MCFPPYCEPARRVFGCVGLRKGAAGVLAANAFYGLALVVVHALLLGEYKKGGSTQSTKGISSHWLLQLVDLDIGWSHRLLGFPDYNCLVCGMIYGILVLVLSSYMCHAVLKEHTGNIPGTARWFVAWMNLEIILYVGIVLAKLPKLCKVQKAYLLALNMNCDLLRYMYLQRVVIFLVSASLGIWIFGSFAYWVTFGDAAIDQPHFAEIPEDDNDGPRKSGYQRRFLRTPGNRTSVSPNSVSMTAPARSTVSMPRPAGQPGLQRSVHSMQAMRGGMSMVGPPRAAHSMSFVPRQSSSMVTSTTDHSQAETRSLIRPPVAVH